jgi:hypothetical protein
LAGLVLIAVGQPWPRVLVMMAATGTGGVIGDALRRAFPRRGTPPAWSSMPFPPERLD